MKILCQYTAGSHSYALNSADSDIDTRGVFAAEELPEILGLHNPNPVITKEAGDDSVFYEVRHFLNLLKKGSSQCIEMVFNKSWEKIDPLFKNIIHHKHNLIDPEKVYNSIKGYSFSEYRYACGMNPGKIGFKRQQEVEKWGFSPKSWTNLLRILYCAESFFTYGVYPVSMIQEPTYEQLKDIKFHPEKYKMEDLNVLYTEQARQFEKAWVESKADICAFYKYDEEVAARLILDCYTPVLFNHMELGLWQRIKH